MHPRDAVSSKKMGGASSNVAGIICPPWSEKGLTDIPKLGGAYAPPPPPASLHPSFAIRSEIHL